MTFDEWWASITPAEQKVIGRTNAKFVWLEAINAERNRLAAQCERLPFGNTAQSFAALIKSGGQIELKP